MQTALYRSALQLLGMLFQECTSTFVCQTSLRQKMASGKASLAGESHKFPSRRNKKNSFFLSPSFPGKTDHSKGKRKRSLGGKIALRGKSRPIFPWRENFAPKRRLGLVTRPKSPRVSRDTCRTTPVILCFLWYRRLSLLHPPLYVKMASCTPYTGGIAEKLVFEAYRAIGGIA